MSTHPTHRVTFDPAALTDDQRDGFTCVVCGRDLATGGPSVPVGTVPGGLQLLGGQVFACASHVAERPDPNACIRCGRDFTTGRAVIPNVPVRRVDGVLMFACVTCPQAEDDQGDDELTERAARRATWPSGEPAEVRELAERTQRQAEANDGLSRDFADSGDADMSRVFADVARAFRQAATALESGGDTERAAMVAEEAVKRARAALDARTAR